jgi:periplasmic divalent cation tolerance protein
MSNLRIVLSTTGSRDEARKIANTLVARGLAACVNIVPQIESVYRWQGKLESSQEFLLLAKTTAEQVPKVFETIQSLHSYELPECIALEITAGTEAYVGWIEANSAGA